MDIGALRPGLRLSGWTLGRLLGRGGSGETWSAEDEHGLPVVVKLLRPRSFVDPALSKALWHPGLAPLLAVGQHPAAHVVMGYVRGRPLTDFLRSGAAPEAVALELVCAVADALAALHEAGLSHGDLTPGNVLVETLHGPRIKLVDYGLCGPRHVGTLAYAAPERLAGGPATPAADSYALGLLMFELLHGHEPWPGIEVGEALQRRAEAAPECRRGSPSLRALVGALLDPVADRRPPAAEVVEYLLAAGVTPPPPDLGLLRRRAQAVHIFPEVVREAFDGWLERGGRLALVGGPGSGRSHALDLLARALGERGRPVLRLWSCGQPWAAGADALQSHALPGALQDLPAIVDPEQRAARIARLLVDRCPDGFAVLCDDEDEQDPTVRLLLAALSRRGEVAIAVTGRVPPPWSDDQCLLEALDVNAIARLVRELFGSIRGGKHLAERLVTATEGLPGPCLALLLEAVATGALAWRARRWNLDEDRVRALLERRREVVCHQRALGADAAAVGAAVAVIGHPAPVSKVGHLLAMPEDRLLAAITELVEAGLVRLEGRRLSCRGLGEARTLATLAADPGDLHRRVADLLLTRDDPDWIRVGWHLAAAADPALIGQHAGPALDAALARDGGAAADLADALWAAAPLPGLVVPRLRILLAAGRAPEARRLAEERLGNEVPGVGELPVLEALARIQGGEGRWSEALTCVERARLVLGDSPLPRDLAEIEIEALLEEGRWPAAASAAEALAAGPCPEGAEDGDRWLRLRCMWARAREGCGDPTGALNALAQIPDSLGRGRPARAAADALLGRLYEQAGRLRDALEALERAAHEESGASGPERGRLLLAVARARCALGDFAGAAARLEQAEAVAERAGNPAALLLVRVELCDVLRVRGRAEEAVRAGRWAAQQAAASGDAEMEAEASVRVGDICLSEGFWREAQVWYRRAEVVAGEHGVRGIAARVARGRAEVAVERKDPRATALAERARQLAAQARLPAEGARAEALLALCHARAGRGAEVGISAERTLVALRQQGAGCALAEARLWIAEAWLQLGRTDLALAEATRSLVFSEEVGHLHLLRRAQVLAERLRGIEGSRAGADRLGRLLDLAGALVEEREQDRVLGAIAQAARDLLEAERAFVLLVEEGGALRLAATALGPGVMGGEPSMAVVRRVLEDGREVLAADLGEREDLRDAESIVSMDLRSAMCVPLIVGGARAGAVYVDSRVVNTQELASAARLLRALAGFAAVAIANARHLRAASRQGQQAAELAHDLRSPATAIHVIVSERLARLPEGDPEREPLLRVLEAAQRIRSMAGSILEEERPADRPVDLSSLVERVVGLLRYVAAQRDLRLETVITPNLWVTGEPQELSRMVTNLVSNALKFAPAGSRVSVGLGQDERGVIGMVRDRGPGVPPGAEDVVFTRGWCAPGSQGGHGLGLYICRRIVEAHGGSVEVRNHPKGGAVFTFRLPRRLRAWDSLSPEGPAAG